MFSVRLITGEILCMNQHQLQSFCWDWGVDFSVVEKAIDTGKETFGMQISSI